MKSGPVAFHAVVLLVLSLHAILKWISYTYAGHLGAFSSMARRERNGKISPLHTSVAHLHIRLSRQVLSPGAKARIEVQGMRLSLDPAYCAITPIQGPSRCHLVLRENDRRRMTAHPQLPRQHVRRRVCMSKLRVLVLRTRQERTPIMSRKRTLL